jgi:hypothetical protein
MICSATFRLDTESRQFLGDFSHLIGTSGPHGARLESEAIDI